MGLKTAFYLCFFFFKKGRSVEMGCVVFFVRDLHFIINLSNAICKGNYLQNPAQQSFKFCILNLVGNVQRVLLTPLSFCVCSDCTKLQRTSLYFGFRWPSERHQRSVGLSTQQQSVLQCCHEHRRGHTYLDSKNIYLYREVGTSGTTLIWGLQCLSF